MQGSEAGRGQLPPFKQLWLLVPLCTTLLAPAARFPAGLLCAHAHSYSEFRREAAVQQGVLSARYKTALCPAFAATGRQAIGTLFDCTDCVCLAAQVHAWECSWSLPLPLSTLCAALTLHAAASAATGATLLMACTTCACTPPSGVWLQQAGCPACCPLATAAAQHAGPLCQRTAARPATPAPSFPCRPTPAGTACCRPRSAHACAPTWSAAARARAALHVCPQRGRTAAAPSDKGHAVPHPPGVVCTLIEC